LDTRTKILTPGALASLDLARPLLLATGRFDILRAEAARTLAETRSRAQAQCLVVVIRPLEGELAPIAARAEMAAALRAVDYVAVLADEPLENLAAALRPDETISLDEADDGRIRQLIEHVRHGRP